MKRRRKKKSFQVSIKFYLMTFGLLLGGGSLLLLGYRLWGPSSQTIPVIEPPASPIRLPGPGLKPSQKQGSLVYQCFQPQAGQKVERLLPPSEEPDIQELTKPTPPLPSSTVSSPTPPAVSAPAKPQSKSVIPPSKPAVPQSKPVIPKTADPSALIDQVLAARSGLQVGAVIASLPEAKKRMAAVQRLIAPISPILHVQLQKAAKKGGEYRVIIRGAKDPRQIAALRDYLKRKGFTTQPAP